MFRAPGPRRLRSVLQPSVGSHPLLHHRLQLLRRDQRREAGRDHRERPLRPARVTAARCVDMRALDPPPSASHQHACKHPAKQPSVQREKMSQFGVASGSGRGRGLHLK